MRRNLTLTTALLMLGGCYPWTPPALAPVMQPAGPATGAVPPPVPVPPKPTGGSYTPGRGPMATTPPAGAQVGQDAPATILISIDGFRADYLDRGVTPYLTALAAGGVRAAMRPSFPSKTFPNHWTLVTGVRPDRNGIVANSMEDPARPGELFTMATDDPFWWNEAEPIWVTADRAGLRTATMFWPGSSVAWGGVRSTTWPNPVTGGRRPYDWWPFGQAVTGDQRVAGVLDWLRRPAATRPRLVTLYFDTVDTAGHRFGPDAPETNAALTEVDLSIGRLVAGLRELGQQANLVIVADHGMAATAPERRIVLDTLLGHDAYRAIDTGAFASIVPTPGQEGAVATALARKTAGMTCWPKDRIPARYHYGRNPRVAPLFCLADVGWMIVRSPDDKAEGGNHGYDADARAMRAVFIANGPAFQAGKRIADFDNVDVAPLLRDLLGLPAGQGLDGDDKPFRKVFARSE